MQAGKIFGDLGVLSGQLFETDVVIDVLLNEGNAFGRNTLGDMTFALASLEHVIGAPLDGFSILGAGEELFGKAASFHAVQSGHLVEDLGAGL